MSNNKPLRQSDRSYRRTLATLGNRVIDGVKLSYEDSDQTGNKYTICSLGLCDRDIEKSMDGIYRAGSHVCPNDRRYVQADGTRTSNADYKTDPHAHFGCFYHCHIFQGTSRKQKDVEERIAKFIGEVVKEHT